MRMPHPMVLASLIVGLVATGCHSDSLTSALVRSDTAPAVVAVSRVPGSIRLTNHTDRPIAYAVWNRGWLALFGPCVDTGPACPRLAPAASVQVPDSAMGGYTPSMHEAVVRWWHVVPASGGGLRADEVREIVVPL